MPGRGSALTARRAGSCCPGQSHPRLLSRPAGTAGPLRVCRGTPRVRVLRGVQGTGLKQICLSKAALAVAKADHHPVENKISPLTGWATGARPWFCPRAVHGWHRAPGQVGRGWSDPALHIRCSQHTAQVTSCMQVRPSTSTAEGQPTQDCAKQRCNRDSTAPELKAVRTENS